MIRIGLCTEVANASIVADTGIDFIEENNRWSVIFRHVK